MTNREPRPVPPPPFATIPRFLRAGVARHGDKPFLLDPDGGEPITYARFGVAMEAAASDLAKRGYGKGDRIVICLDNGAPLVAAFAAVIVAGCTPALANPTHPNAEVEGVCRRVGATALIAGAGQVEDRDLIAGMTVIDDAVFDPRSRRRTRKANPATARWRASDVAYIIFPAARRGRQRGA